MENFPILLTSAINTSSSITEYHDRDKRIQATLNSIKNWLNLNNGLNVVICDGTGFDFTTLINENFPNSKIEVLSFKNNSAKVIALGKGYGEGEIVNFALENSEFLLNSRIFAKCTAKLWVKNFGKLAKKMDQSIKIQPLVKLPKKVSDFIPDAVDTRFYIVDKEYFKKFLGNAHLYVDDMAGNFLEHEYFRQIQKSRLSLKKIKFNPEPVILGISGTSGFEYTHGNKVVFCFKRFIRRLILNVGFILMPLNLTTRQTKETSIGE